MTARQFNAAAKDSHLSTINVARARRVLVDGERPCDVAYSEGITKNTIHATLRKVARLPSDSDRFWPMLAPPPRPQAG